MSSMQQPLAGNQCQKCGVVCPWEIREWTPKFRPVEGILRVGVTWRMCKTCAVQAEIEWSNREQAL